MVLAIGLMRMGNRMLVNTECIRATTRGYRIDKKAAGKARLRRTFKTYHEAVAGLESYMEGTTVHQYFFEGTTWLDLFNNSKRRRWKHVKNSSQLKVAKRVIDKYLGWLSDASAFDQAKADYLEDKLEARKLRPSTINHYFSAIRVMLRDGKQFELVNWSIPELRHIKQERIRVNYFTYDQESAITRIIRNMGMPDVAFFFTLSIETGMRTSEVENLMWRDVDLENRLIQVWGNTTKSGRDRRVPITQMAAEALESCRKFRDRNGLVLLDATEKRRRRAWIEVRKIMQNYSEDFIWYTTRHTCATRLVKAGVDLHTVQSWLGHSCIETTMRYIQFSASAFGNATRALEDARKLRG